MKCKCVKGIDGFTWGETCDVEFAGRVWWAVNDDGKKVCGASETFEECELGEKPYDIETNTYDNPVDAAFEMVMHLHELNLL